MHRLALLLPVLALAGCSDKTYLLPHYCGNNDGDAYCAREDPEHPYCVLGFDECFEAANLGEFSNGCVAEAPPPECSSPCGVDNGDACVDPTNPTESSSSGSTTDEPSSTTEDETETNAETDDLTTTTGPECMGNPECMDPALPFCIEQTCSPCSASVDVSPDEACAGLDEAAPLCVDDACVQCTVEDASACGDTTPLCDAESNTCVACSFHEECQDIGSPACNLTTGACFDPQAVTEVSLSSANALQNAIDTVADGAEHAIVITGGSGLHTAAVDGGKTIAIVSNSSAVRAINGNTAPVLTVTGNSTTAFLHRIRLEDSDDVGIAVTSGASLFADSTQVAQNAGGGVTLASGTSAQLRNCIIGLNGSGLAATEGIQTAGDLTLLYSSVIANDGSGPQSLTCSGGSALVRNSILVGQDASSVSCGVIDASNSASDGVLAGAENENVGPLNTGWFVNAAGGDFRLSPTGQTEFADIAAWLIGDPPFDFEGDARPNVDGTADHAGADTP
ncbi:MAG: right-handed parallel beta-helix repeat-containing protein [Nannocystales bacterium]